MTLFQKYWTLDVTPIAFRHLALLATSGPVIYIVNIIELLTLIASISWCLALIFQADIHFKSVVIINREIMFAKLIDLEQSKMSNILIAIKVIPILYPGSDKVVIVKEISIRCTN